MKRTLPLFLVVTLLLSLFTFPASAGSAFSSRLLAEYSFNDQTTNDAVGGNNATLYNNADTAEGTYIDGINGKALKLSTKGTDDKFWLSIPYSVFGNSTDSFTISMLYRADDYNQEGENSELISLYNSGAEKFLFHAPVLNPNIGFTMKWDGTYGYANVISPYAQGQWKHLVYCVEAVEGQSRISAYIDGAAVEVDQGGAWADSLMSTMGINTFTIGGKNPYKGGATPNCLFYGAVDEIRVYSGVLSAAEAYTVYDETVHPASARGTLLAEYNFDDQTTDDSIGGNDATFINNATAATGTYINGVSGKALKLSTKGTGEKFWLSVPYSVFGGNKNSFTISMWYRADDYNQEGENSELFSLYNSSAEKFLFYAPVLSSKMGLTMKWDGSYGYANVITPYAQGQWKHLVYCVDAVDGQSRITAYIDGAAVEVDQGGAWENSLMTTLGINTFTIGGKNPYKGGATPNCLFYGAVDEIKLYAGVLNASEAAALYDEVVNPVAARGTLLAEYNFDAQNTEDSVSGKDATFVNNATETTGTYINGVSGKALKLSTKGTDDKFWLSVPYSVFGGNKDSFTISMWYRADDYNATGENSELISLYNSSAEKFLFHAPVLNPNIGFTMKWDGTYGYANVISPYAQGQWKHLVYCVDAVEGQSRISAYIDGAAVEVDQGGAWENSLMTTMGINTFTIGGKNPYKGGATPNCLFYGAVDEIRLYAGVLNASEAAALYNEVANQPKERGTLLAEYNFDDQNTEDSIGSKDAALFNNADTASGNYINGISGKALKLSTKGTDEKYWLSVPYSAFGGNRDSFTVSMWYRTDDYNTSGEDSELFSLYNSSAERFLFYSPAATGFQDKAFVMKWDGTYGYANVITAYNQGVWVNLVFAVDSVEGESVITTYVNGQAVEVDQGGAWADSLMTTLGINTFTIGGKNPYKGGATPNCLFYGAVDEVRLYAGALNAEEAAAIYAEHTHNFEEVETVKASCTEDGSIEYECTVCGQGKTEVIKASGHNYVNGICEHCGTEDPDASVELKSAYLRINEDINVIYTAKVPASCEAPYMVFTYQGTDYTVTDYTVDADGLYCFELSRIVPQCMGDNICATVYAQKNGETVSDTVAEYSVRTYCVNQLETAQDPALVTLLSDLLTYGAAAQTYTGYKADALVTEGLALTPSSFSGISAAKASFEGDADADIDWNSATLVLSNALTVRMYFTASSVDGLTVEASVNGRTENYDADDFVAAGEGKYYIDFRGIMATEFDDAVTASFRVGGETVGRTLSYSVNTYISGVQNTENANLQALVRALYNYGAAAAAYAPAN